MVIGDSQWVGEHFNGQMLGSNLYIEDVDTYLDALTYTNKLCRSGHVEQLRYGHLIKEKILAYEKIFTFPCELFFDSWNWYREEAIIKPKSIRYVYSDIEFLKPKKRHTIQVYEMDLIKRARKDVWYCRSIISSECACARESIRSSANFDLSLEEFVKCSITDIFERFPMKTSSNAKPWFPIPCAPVVAMAILKEIFDFPSSSSSA